MNWHTQEEGHWPPLPKLVKSFSNECISDDDTFKATRADHKNEEPFYEERVRIETSHHLTIPESIYEEIGHLLQTIPFDEILAEMLRDQECAAERLIFHHRGYTLCSDENKTCETLQGSRHRSEFTSISPDGTQTSKAVSIKKVDRELHRKRITIQDGMTFVVEEGTNYLRTEYSLRFFVTESALLVFSESY